MNENMKLAIQAHLDDMLFNDENFFIGSNDRQTMTELIEERLMEHLNNIANDEITSYKQYVKNEG